MGGLSEELFEFGVHFFSLRHVAALFENIGPNQSDYRSLVSDTQRHASAAVGKLVAGNNATQR